MTPTHPLTPTEHAAIDAALKVACAELDTRRFDRIATCHDLRRRWSWNPTDPDPAISHDDERLHSGAYHLAAALLAGQMAERL